MFCRIHDDARMPQPNDQITGLRICYPNKTVNSGIEVKGISVRIKIAGNCVHFVN